VLQVFVIPVQVCHMCSDKVVNDTILSIHQTEFLCCDVAIVNHNLTPRSMMENSNVLCSLLGHLVNLHVYVRVIIIYTALTLTDLYRSTDIWCYIDDRSMFVKDGPIGEPNSLICCSNTSRELW